MVYASLVPGQPHPAQPGGPVWHPQGQGLTTGLSLLEGITGLTGSLPHGCSGRENRSAGSGPCCQPPLLMDACLLVLLNPDGWAQINPCGLSKQPAEPYIVQPPPRQAARSRTQSCMCQHDTHRYTGTYTQRHICAHVCIQSYLHTGMVTETHVHGTLRHTS